MEKRRKVQRDDKLISECTWLDIIQFIGLKRFISIMFSLYKSYREAKNVMTKCDMQ